MVGSPTLADTYIITVANTQAGHLGVSLVEQAYWGEGASHLQANMPNGQGERLCGTDDATSCESLLDSASSFYGVVNLPKCSGDDAENCVESLDIYSESADPAPATFMRMVAGSTVPASSSLGNPAGSTSSLWKAGGSSSTVTTFDVLVALRLGWQDGHFNLSGLQASVLPYTLAPREGQSPSTWRNSSWSNGVTHLESTGGTPDCYWVDKGECGKPLDFSPGTKVRLSLRISKDLGGWFSGRMESPTISVASISTKQNRISIDAKPVFVPQFSASIDLSNDPEKLADYMGFDKVEHPQGGGMSSTGTSGQHSIDLVSKFRNQTKDTASGQLSMWGFTTTAGVGECLGDTSKVQGVVSTNAMVYEGNAPAFVNGELNYKVGGLHYLEDGKSLATGTYDMVMRSDTARCLYGFSSAPINATVSVVDSDGQEKVAVTNVTERNDWLHLSATGFTFSTNKITAKLTQAKPPTPSPTPSAVSQSPAPKVSESASPAPTASKSPAAPRYIVCKPKTGKGKAIRIMGTKCPKGFLKK